MARAPATDTAFIRVKLHDLSFPGLSLADLARVTEYQLKCSEATRQNKPVPQLIGMDRDVQLLLKTMTAMSASMTHTDQYATVHGRFFVLSMWNHYGPPIATIMLTLNPNDLASMQLLHDANVPGPGVPPLSVRYSTLADSPGAAALSFVRPIDVFIRHVVGFDVKHKSVREGEGFLGIPIAVFGAVEEQNRGSLHLQELDEDQRNGLLDRMNAYVKSIMTAMFQCPSQFHPCSYKDQHASQQLGGAAQSVQGHHFGQIDDIGK